MARKFNGMLDEWVEYVPEVWGERDVFESDPDNAITMELHYLTRADLKRYERMAMVASKRKSGASNKEQEQMKELLGKNVRNIKNLDSPDDGLPITDGYELFMRGEGELILDVTSAIVDRSKLEAGLSKKLNLRFDTLISHRKSNETGNVRDVTQVSPKIVKGTSTNQNLSYDYQTKKKEESEIVIAIPTTT